MHARLVAGDNGARSPSCFVAPRAARASRMAGFEMCAQRRRAGRRDCRSQSATRALCFKERRADKLATSHNFQAGPREAHSTIMRGTRAASQTHRRAAPENLHEKGSLHLGSPPVSKSPLQRASCATPRTHPSRAAGPMRKLADIESTRKRALRRRQHPKHGQVCPGRRLPVMTRAGTCPIHAPDKLCLLFGGVFCAKLDLVGPHSTSPGPIRPDLPTLGMGPAKPGQAQPNLGKAGQVWPHVVRLRPARPDIRKLLANFGQFGPRLAKLAIVAPSSGQY